jgi:hypothetical protein
MSIQIARESRWPAFEAMLAAAGVYLALPAPLSFGPSWLLLVVIVLLLIPIVVSDRRGHHDVTRILTLTTNLIITIAMIASLIHLVTGIPQHLEAPKALLRSASALPITLLDISETAIAVSKKRIGAASEQIRWLVANVIVTELEPRAQRVLPLHHHRLLLLTPKTRGN